MKWLFLLFAVLAQGQIYKWVDEKGRVQYGERPPPGVKSSPLREEASPGGKPKPPEDFARQDADFKLRQQNKQRADEQAARQADVRRQNCNAARERLSYAERNPRPYRLQGQERIYLSETEREAQIAKLRAIVSQQCG